MLKIILLVFTFEHFAQTSAQSKPYTSLVWSSCSTGAQTPGLIFERLSILPMPMVHPGEHVVDFRAVVQRKIDGALPATFNMIRTVTGISLPIRCTIVQGLGIGSCSYTDLCKDFFRDILGNTPENCPPEFEEWGIDCTCPFYLPVKTIEDNITFNTGNIEDSWINYIYFGTGDYELTVTINNNRGEHVACFKFLYSNYKNPAI